MTVDDCVITSKNNLAKGIFDMWIKSQKMANEAKPGQFVNVKCDGFTLRRPISICDINHEKGKIRLVFEERGEGTEWLAEKNVGDCLDILGPLGNGFLLGEAHETAIFVGGGIGVPPLLGAAKHYGARATAILGFKSAANVILKEDFARYGAEVEICTDDGTMGKCGTVIEPLLEKLNTKTCSSVFACGPKPMLKAVAEICLERNITCFVSMEERMACGVGACLCCAVKVNDDGREKFSHVCKDGPIFDAKSIVW